MLIVMVVHGLYVKALLPSLPHTDLAHGLEVIVGHFFQKNARIINNVTIIIYFELTKYGNVYEDFLL